MCLNLIKTWINFTISCVQGYYDYNYGVLFLEQCWHVSINYNRNEMGTALSTLACSTLIKFEYLLAQALSRIRVLDCAWLAHFKLAVPVYSSIHQWPVAPSYRLPFDLVVCLSGDTSTRNGSELVEATWMEHWIRSTLVLGPFSWVHFQRERVHQIEKPLCSEALDGNREIGAGK